MCWQKAHVVNHIIYKTVKYVMILHLVLNQEPQQHINLTVHWCNHRVLFHSRLFNSSWAFMITLIITIIFLLHISSWPPKIGIWKVLKMWSLQKIVLKLETSRKVTQIHYLLKIYSFITFLNKCNSIHIQVTELSLYKLSCRITS